MQTLADNGFAQSWAQSFKAIVSLTSCLRGHSLSVLRLFGSPGRSPGTAIVLTPASALALVSAAALANVKVLR